MQKNILFIIFIISTFSLQLAAETVTILEAVVLCGDKLFKPSVTQQPKDFKPYDANVPWVNYTTADKKSCFVGTGYQNKTNARLAVETIISRAGQLLVTAPIAKKPEITLRIKVVSTNDKNITLTEANVTTLLPDAKIIGDAFDLVNAEGNVLQKQCYLLAIKKKDMTQAELDSALENIRTTATGVADVSQG